MLVGKDLGPFQIEMELGSGAMGTVYRAINRETGQRVALKVIALGLLGNETAVKRFEREADILKQLKHPNIVRLIGSGHYKKTPFFIMEYVEGESLDRILARRTAFSWQEVVALGQQLCAALQHAHQKGIIHRDLKPSNLMILADGTVKLTDFGIAKDTDVTALTGANCTVGTASYMSPEQCKGEKNLSHKSDLYSLGIVFYELLTGRKPFAAESPVDMFLAHVNGTFERPSRLALDIPVWLDTLVCQLMEKKPEHRPFDAAMVAKVLGEVESKVKEQRSAGVDAATARNVDRVPNRPAADETDREAARALRGGKRKKNVKKVVPFFERTWVRAAVLLAALGGLAGFLWFMTKPPAAEHLYRVVQHDAEKNDVEALLRDAERYLALYGSRGDEPAKQVRAMWYAAWAEKREQQIHNRYTSRFGGDLDDGMKLAIEALQREDEGDVDRAKAAWTALEAKFRDDADADQRAYALAARRKLEALADLDAKDQRLLVSINDPQRGRAVDVAEADCREARRYEEFGDLPKARDRFHDIADKALKQLGTRPWGVYASWRAKPLKARAVTGTDHEREFRAKLLRDKMGEINIRPNPDPQEVQRARVIAREIAELYKNDPVPEVREMARQADQKLRTQLRPIS